MNTEQWQALSELVQKKKKSELNEAATREGEALYTALNNYYRKYAKSIKDALTKLERFDSLNMMSLAGKANHVANATKLDQLMICPHDQLYAHSDLKKDKRNFVDFFKSMEQFCNIVKDMQRDCFIKDVDGTINKMFDAGEANKKKIGAF